MATYQYVNDGRPDGAVFGQSAADLIAFYNTAPVAQPSGAAQAQLSPASLVTSLAGFGFYNATIAACFVGQVDEIRRCLTLLGLWKGAS